MILRAAIASFSLFDAYRSFANHNTCAWSQIEYSIVMVVDLYSVSRSASNALRRRIGLPCR